MYKINKLLITGSRSIRDYRMVASVLKHYRPNTLIHGGAHGVDNIAGRYYKARNTKIDMVPVRQADYRKLGNYAYILRDQVMVNKADHVVAIWDGHSKGTGHTIRLAKERGIPCDIYTLDNGQLMKKVEKSVQTVLI